MAAEKPENFRAIIVGGGPVALTAAHALSQAGIDYIILERRKALDTDSGASVAIWPHNVRLLDQLGLYEEAEQTYMPVLNKQNLRRDGTVLSKSNMFEAIGINHGHPWMCFHRAKLINMLYQRLPDPSKVLLDKEVISIENAANSVTVGPVMHLINRQNILLCRLCADQTTYTASIIIGADGVHSSVRRLVNEASGKTEDPFMSSYRGLYGYAKRSPELEPATLYETHSANLTIQLIVAEQQQHFLVYERLPKATRERTRYTEEDADALAKKYADVRFPTGKDGEFVTWGDIWANKQWSVLANLEEGIVKNWHEGRAVLVGDAVHKMTPNTGFGMNSGLQGVAQLVNRLRSQLKQTPEPDVATLSRVFSEYQSARLANSKEAVEVSGLYTRLVAWNNPVWRFTDQYLLPYVKGDNTSLNVLMSPIVQKGVPLDFLEEKRFKRGTYAYHTGPVTASAAA